MVSIPVPLPSPPPQCRPPGIRRNLAACAAAQAHPQPTAAPRPPRPARLCRRRRRLAAAEAGRRGGGGRRWNAGGRVKTGQNGQKGSCRAVSGTSGLTGMKKIRVSEKRPCQRSRAGGDSDIRVAASARLGPGSWHKAGLAPPPPAVTATTTGTVTGPPAYPPTSPVRPRPGCRANGPSLQGIRVRRTGNPPPRPLWAGAGCLMPRLRRPGPECQVQVAGRLGPSRSESPLACCCRCQFLKALTQAASPPGYKLETQAWILI